MTDSPAEGLRTSYDAVAQAYERRYGEELQHKPLDRALLRVFADEVGPASVVGDVGCGRRVLVPGAPALLAFHVGDEVRHVDELLEQTVSVDFHFRQPADVTRLLQAAGFDVEMSMERAAYISIEAPTQRGYLLARAS
jgi:hypothetical protein